METLTKTPAIVRKTEKIIAKSILRRMVIVLSLIKRFMALIKNFIVLAILIDVFLKKFRLQDIILQNKVNGNTDLTFIGSFVK